MPGITTGVPTRPACTTLALCLAVCTAVSACDTKSDSTLAQPRETTDFEKLARAAAREYSAWTRVSDRANWAPTNCMLRPPAGAQPSASDDDPTHGRKLYYLFAKDAQAYENVSFSRLADERHSPVGQVLVKQSFAPVEADAPPAEHAARGFDAPPLPRESDRARIGDKWYRPADATGLFIMLKLDPATPNTDQGWVYATVDADGTSVLECGRIESCMKCHEKTEADRLFGLPRGRK